MSSPAPADELRQSLRLVREFAHQNTYTTAGNTWRQFIASLAFETKCDVCLIRDLEELDQARFLAVSHAYMTHELEPDEVRDIYLEFFPRPQRQVGRCLIAPVSLLALALIGEACESVAAGGPRCSINGSLSAIPSLSCAVLRTWENLPGIQGRHFSS